MNDIKWIKLTTDMFDNRKIRYLRRLPDGNNIVLIWIMLLTMAGRCNSSGMIFLTENIPYTPKILADELGFEENTVVLALKALEQLDMIVSNDGFFSVPGWEEYQNIDGMAKIREQTRKRVAKCREKQKQICNATCNATVTESNATDKDIDKELDIDKEEDKDIELIEKENIQKKKPKEEKHKYGEYQHVFLTDRQYEKLINDYGKSEADSAIKFLDEYIQMKGYKAKDHNLALRKWVFEAVKREQAEKNKQFTVNGERDLVNEWRNS